MQAIEGQLLAGTCPSPTGRNWLAAALVNQHVALEGSLGWPADAIPPSVLRSLERRRLQCQGSVRYFPA